MSLESINVRRLESFIASNRGRFEDELAALVEVPTVSLDPQHRADIERGADLAVRILRAAGATAEKIPTRGNPIVVGDLQGQGAWSTVTVYNHMDVQPADPVEWTHHPFRFLRRDGWYGGRGTTDDKGPALSALLAARYAVENGIPLNIRFIWDLEEEIGSPSFDEFLQSRGATFQTDSVLVSDTIWIARGRPAIAYALRGLQAVLLVLQTGAKDVHSGVAGGLARNPVAEMCEVLAELQDARSGRVRVPGFYRRVRRPTKKEVDSFLRSGFSTVSFKAAHELSSLRRASSREAVQRIWSMPTLEVHGIRGGYQGPGVKTVVPARAEAKVSMRLVPDQRPHEVYHLLKRYVKGLHSEVEVQSEQSLEPYLGEFSGPFADAARDAFQFAFGKDPAFVREGGSIGPVVSMKKKWGCSIVLMGLSLPEHGYHCPNEHFDWTQASGGVKAFVKYFDTIAHLA